MIKLYSTTISRNFCYMFICRTLINDLIYCYTVTIKCNLFEAVRWTESFWNDDLPDFPFPQYVGVESSYTYHTTFTSRVLAYLTSKPIEDQNIRYVKFCFHVFSNFHTRIFSVVLHQRMIVFIIINQSKGSLLPVGLVETKPNAMQLLLVVTV